MIVALGIHADFDFFLKQFGIKTKAGTAIFPSIITALSGVHGVELALIATAEFEFLEDGVHIVFIEGGVTPELVKGAGLKEFGRGTLSTCEHRN